MITRYDDKEMSECWSLEKKFQHFLQVELALLSSLEEVKAIPAGIAAKVENTAKINLNRIDQIESEVKHDVIAFTTSISEQLPKNISKYFHFGATSSDIIDTALSLTLKDSLQLMMKTYLDYCQSFEKLIEKSSGVLCLGRSHGMYAEPMIFAGKWLGFYAEALRILDDLHHFSENHLTGQFSGAVGNYTILTHEVEELANNKLGLKTETSGTQVIPRDRLARLASTMALLGSHLERLSTEIRLLHHSDVGEVAEGFGQKQKGSSTMPHKKNPVSSENITGLARMLRSYQNIALENVVLWHERDISHSSAERLYLPDMFGLALYSLKRMTGVLHDLELFTDKIENKVSNQKAVQSSFYLHQLILLTKHSREELYDVIQALSFQNKTVNWKEELSAKFPEVKNQLKDFDQVAMKAHYQEAFCKTKKRVDDESVAIKKRILNFLE